MSLMSLVLCVEKIMTFETVVYAKYLKISWNCAIIVMQISLNYTEMAYINDIDDEISFLAIPVT